MSYIDVKNLIEYKSTIQSFNYIKKYDNKKHYIYIKTKSQNKSNIQFTLHCYNHNDNDIIVIDKNTINIEDGYFSINASIKKDKPLKIKIISLNSELKISILNLKTLYESPNNISIDMIYVINLSRKIDRKNAMIEKFKQQNITNYEFIDAIDGSLPEIKNDYEQCKKMGGKFVSSGHYACLKSHTKALEAVQNSNYNNVLILEDDVIFRDDFLQSLSKYKIPFYDVLYFGGLTKTKKLFLNGWNECRDIMGLYCYMVNKNIISTIIKKFKTEETYCDRMMVNNIQNNPQYKIILLNDLIYTTLEDTDTSGKSKLMYDMIEKQKNQLNIL